MDGSGQPIGPEIQEGIDRLSQNGNKQLSLHAA